MKSPALIFLIIVLSSLFALAGLLAQKSSILSKSLANSSLAMEMRCQAESASSAAAYDIIKSSLKNDWRSCTGNSQIETSSSLLQVSVSDAANGLDFTRMGRSFDLSPEELQQARNALQEYTSQGSLAWSKGRPLEFQEEVFWLPAFQDLLKRHPVHTGIYFRPLPPYHLSSSLAKPYFFSASAEEFYDSSDLSREESLQLRELLDKSKTHPDILIMDNFLVKKAAPFFSMKPSGIYRVRVTAAREDGLGRVTYEVILDLSHGSLSRISKQGFLFWQQSVE